MITTRSNSDLSAGSDYYGDCTLANCNDRLACFGDTLCFPHKIKEIRNIFKQRRMMMFLKPPCNEEGCVNQACIAGKCYRHSGKWGCKHPGCSKLRQGGGFCVAHGGIHRQSKCHHLGCTKTNAGGGFCRRHGGGSKCKYRDCGKVCNGHICVAHLRSVPTEEIRETLLSNQ